MKKFMHQLSIISIIIFYISFPSEKYIAYELRKYEWRNETKTEYLSFLGMKLTF